MSRFIAWIRAKFSSVDSSGTSKANLLTWARVFVAVVAYFIALVPSLMFGTFVAYFVGAAGSVWAAAVILGVPAVAAWLVDRKVFGGRS